MLIKQGQQTYDTRKADEIPDLWHIAHGQPDAEACAAILKTWYAAHAYAKALNDLEPYTPPNRGGELDVTDSF